MERIKFNWRTGTFNLDSDQIAAVSKLLRGVHNREYSHSTFARTMLGPIRTTAVYRAWTDDLFAHQRVPYGVDHPRVAISDYIGVAFYTSPDGTAQYVRPGRRYVRPTFTMIQGGMEIGWYDLLATGWNMLQQHIGEVAEEIARKRDTLAQTALDAAIGSTYTVESPGRLTKAAVDKVFRLAATNKFPVNRAVINPATALDIGEWQFPNNWMWQTLPERYGDQVLREGMVTNYGGIQWIARDWAPAGTVYFSGDPSANGQFHFEYGDPRQDSDEDIDNAMTRYVFREQHGYLIQGGMALYKITIT
jgi:hypothetical protein